MYQDYCFRCGSHVPIDELTKLCGACYSGWLKGKRPGQPERNGG